MKSSTTFLGYCYWSQWIRHEEIAHGAMVDAEEHETAARSSKWEDDDEDDEDEDEEEDDDDDDVKKKMIWALS